jgi:hypothetical protein
MENTMEKNVYTINPITKRKIQVNGQCYKRLVRNQNIYEFNPIWKNLPLDIHRYIVNFLDIHTLINYFILNKTLREYLINTYTDKYISRILDYIKTKINVTETLRHNWLDIQFFLFKRSFTVYNLHNDLYKNENIQLITDLYSKMHLLCYMNQYFDKRIQLSYAKRLLEEYPIMLCMKNGKNLLKLIMENIDKRIVINSMIVNTYQDTNTFTFNHIIYNQLYCIPTETDIIIRSSIIQKQSKYFYIPLYVNKKWVYYECTKGKSLTLDINPFFYPNIKRNDRYDYTYVVCKMDYNYKIIKTINYNKAIQKANFISLSNLSKV